MKPTLLLLSLFFVSCQQTEKHQENSQKEKEVELEEPEIKITNAFLQGEWQLDSIEGSKYPHYELLFFTDKDRFKRFNITSREFLIEDFKWDKDSVYTEDGFYKIIALDSEHIQINLNNKNYIFYRNYGFDSSEITHLMHARPLIEKLIGNWKVIRADIFPITIPNCRAYYFEGTVFKFDTNWEVNIIAHDTTKYNQIENFHYGISYWEDSTISIGRGCMSGTYKIQKITNTTLLLTGGFKPASEVIFQKVK